MSVSKPWIVIKFGGNSVADLACWRTIAEITQVHLDKGYRPLIVCSALVGVTNQLEKLIEAAHQGQHEKILQEIIANYQKLAFALSVDFNQILQSDLEKLKRLVVGISLLQEASPSTQAKVLSFGEIFLTKLAASYLQKNFFPVTWSDARLLLKTMDISGETSITQYLSAKCDYHKDEELLEQLNAMDQTVVITQGFIASNLRDETVLLGRGGSDTSAAYFAAKLGAIRCEIWTDVPGIYTSNPHEIPEARLLKSLDYDEAQEIASMGAKILHPYSIPPLKINNIPLYVGFTRQPNQLGTEITKEGHYRDAPIKSVLIKHQVLLIQIETIHMWQQAGFLANVFSYFKKHSLSIDLISTSETNVTVSLDLKIAGHNAEAIDCLLTDLNAISKATVIEPCAAISIVGHNIRAVLPRIGHALKVFEEQKIYLVSQAANDLNLSFVVDESQALRLATKLHAILIEENITGYLFEQSWHEEFLADKAPQKNIPWWQQRQEELLQIAKKQTPVYVYEKNTLERSVDAVKNLKSIQRVFYAMKANYQPDILKLFYQADLGFECVSIGEMEYLFGLFPDINPKRVLFTPNFAPRREYEKALKLGVHVTVDNLHPLIHWPELFASQEIIVRIDPGKGHGHHLYVCTGGENSKFGIPLSDIPQLKQLIKQSNIHLVGLHAHLGSGNLDSKLWAETALFLSKLLPEFPEISILNIGGGLGVPEKPGQKHLDLQALDLMLDEVHQMYPEIEFWLEPGRFLVAEAGVLLAAVTQVKQKGEVNFIGIDAGMHTLIRPALYGSYHQIVNLSRIKEKPMQLAHIVGPICESGDTLGFSRPVPVTTENDILLIANTGAYGQVMSSNYNLRGMGQEYFLAGGENVRFTAEKQCPPLSL
jgi:diaminopimelate decarboxylase/aspartate kinase